MEPLLLQLCGMAKDHEKKTALDLFVNECLTNKEIAQKLGVTEKTIGKWADEGSWKDLRINKQTTSASLVKKFNELLETLLVKRIAFEKLPENKKTEDLKHEYKNVVDEMSKVSAMIERTQEDGKYSLRTHISCIERFMADLHRHDAKLFMKLIDFQKEYFPKLAKDLE